MIEWNLFAKIDDFGNKKMDEPSKSDNSSNIREQKEQKSLN